MRFASCFTLSILLVSRALGQGDEEFDFRTHYVPGQLWAFDQSRHVSLQISAVMNGKIQGAADRVVRTIRKGQLEVLGVKDGQLVEIKVTYDKDCKGRSTSDQATDDAFPLAGQVVKIWKTADGRITNDARDPLPGDIIAELKSFMEGNGAFAPSKPVGIGARWEANPRAVARAFELATTDTGSMRCMLVSLKEVEGRQSGEILVDLTFSKTEGQAQVEGSLQGSLSVDVTTGQLLDGALSGPLTVSGTQSFPAPYGGALTANISGKGSSEIRAQSKLLRDAAPPAPVAPTPPPVVASAGGRAIVALPEALTAFADERILRSNAGPDPFEGSFEGDRLVIEIQKVGARLEGAIRREAEVYPFTARSKDRQLDGEFRAGEDTFPFVATLDGSSMRLETGGATYRLSRRSTLNPLGTEASSLRNPLRRGMQTSALH